MSSWSLQTPHLALVALLLFGVVIHLLSLFKTDRPTMRKATLTVLNLVFVSLLWLFLQPPQTSNSHTALTLLTPGATPAQIRVAERARAAVAVDGNFLRDYDERAIQQHLDLSSIRTTYPQATTLTVLGAGLPEAHWQADPSWEVRFEPPEPRAGLRYVRWPKRLYVGDVLAVSGHISDTDSAFIDLFDPAGDRVERVPVDGEGQFALSATIRSAGRFMYRLELTRPNGEVVESQRLPVHVAEPAPVSLLMLLSAPSFESRSVKQWAGLGGAQLAVRTAISKDRYLDEFVGRGALTAERLDSLDRALLSEFDLVLVDQRALRELSPRAQNALYASVDQDGLGLMVLTRDSEQRVDKAGRFPTLEPYSERQRSLAFSTAGTEIATGSPEVTLATARFSTRPDPRDVMVRDVNGLPVAAFERSGNGRLGVSLVVDSHTLLTSGHADAHARYWRSVVEAMTQQDSAIEGEFAPELPVANQQVQLCVFGPSLPTSAQVNKTHTFVLQPQAYRPLEHCGYWWPDRAGWHVVTASDMTRHVYVFDAQDWTTRRRSEATAATRLAAQRDPVFTPPDYATSEELPRTVFAWWLLLVAGALWLEQKLYRA